MHQINGPWDYRETDYWTNWIMDYQANRLIGLGLGLGHKRPLVC